MKKINSIRALLIALMLVLTFAIPALVSAQNLAAPVDVAEASPIENSAEDPAIVPSKTTPDDSALTDEISDSEDDTGDLAEDSVEEAVEKTTEAEVVCEASPSPLCDYCGSKDHSYAYCAQRAIDNGAVGRWSIPSVGIDVAFYYVDRIYENVALGQRITDAWDSATYYTYNGTYVIADHSNQEFSALKYVSVGAEAYVDYGSYQQKYVCTKFEYGHNDDGTLLDADYNVIYYYDYNDGGITCYTCNGNSYNIILVCFQPVYD